VPLFVSVRRRSPANQASIWHRLAPSGIGAGISYGIKRVPVGSLVAQKGLCLLAFLAPEGWQSGRMPAARLTPERHSRLAEEMK